MLGVVGISTASYGMLQEFYEDPFATTGGEETGGEEEKKKDQAQTNDTEPTGDQDEASTAKDEASEEPVATPPRKEEPKPASSDSKVNSFNFLFEMLYHFNLVESHRRYNDIDPSKEQFLVGMPVRQGRSTIVSY
ncbi:MAG TPA: hypothetical protein DCE41_33125 [Cytophagales bacterium]|nr:hypothetical protein [Cytophagales bacterium]HAA19833.1 hypothetical protein [Cytophagales bacterium]